MEGGGAYVYVLAVAGVKSFCNHCFMVTGIHIPMIDPLFYFCHHMQPAMDQLALQTVTNRT
jgi:hypothetical protein